MPQSIQQSNARLAQGSGNQGFQRTNISARDLSTVSPEALAFSQQANQAIQRGIRGAQQGLTVLSQEQRKEYLKEQALTIEKGVIDSQIYWEDLIESGNIPSDRESFEATFRAWQDDFTKEYDKETKDKFLLRTESMRKSIFGQHQRKVKSLAAKEAAAAIKNSFQASIDNILGAETSGDVMLAKSDADSSLITTDQQKTVIERTANGVAIELAAPDEFEKVVDDTSLTESDKQLYKQSKEQTKDFLAPLQKQREAQRIDTLISEISDLHYQAPSSKQFVQDVENSIAFENLTKRSADNARIKSKHALEGIEALKKDLGPLPSLERMQDIKDATTDGLAEFTGKPEVDTHVNKAIKRELKRFESDPLSYVPPRSAEGARLRKNFDKASRSFLEAIESGDQSAIDVAEQEYARSFDDFTTFNGAVLDVMGYPKEGRPTMSNAEKHFYLSSWNLGGHERKAAITQMLHSRPQPILDSLDSLGFDAKTQPNGIPDSVIFTMYTHNPKDMVEVQNSGQVASSFFDAQELFKDETQIEIDLASSGYKDPSGILNTFSQGISQQSFNGATDITINGKKRSASEVFGQGNLAAIDELADAMFQSNPEVPRGDYKRMLRDSALQFAKVELSHTKSKNGEPNYPKALEAGVNFINKSVRQQDLGGNSKTLVDPRDFARFDLDIDDASRFLKRERDSIINTKKDYSLNVADEIAENIFKEINAGLSPEQLEALESGVEIPPFSQRVADSFGDFAGKPFVMLPALSTFLYEGLREVGKPMSASEVKSKVKEMYAESISSSIEESAKWVQRGDFMSLEFSHPNSAQSIRITDKSGKPIMMHLSEIQDKMDQRANPDFSAANLVNLTVF